MYEVDASFLIHDMTCFATMFRLLLCIEMYDRVLHARVSHMCLALYCFMNMCFRMNDVMLYVRCMLACVNTSVEFVFNKVKT